MFQPKKLFFINEPSIKKKEPVSRLFKPHCSNKQPSVVNISTEYDIQPHSLKIPHNLSALYHNKQ